MSSLPDLSRPGAKLLVQRADRLGDTILALPVVEQLRKWFPDLRIDFLCSPISQSLLKNHPHIHTTHVAKLDGNVRIEGAQKLKATLRTEDYDAYLSLWDHPTYARLGKTCGIPVRIGDSSNLINRWFYTHTVKQSWGDLTQHKTDLNLQLLAPFKMPLDPPVCQLYTSPAWEPVVDELFKKHLDPKKKTVLIFCGTGGSNLGIPTGPLIELIQHLEAYNVVLCYGTVDPSDPVTHVDYPHVMNLNRLVPFEELLSLIKASDYYIGPDTGPTHMASFMNKPMMVFSPKKDLFSTKWGPVTECFRIVRTDTNCTDLCTVTCSRKHPCTTVATDQLFSTFQELVTDVYTQTKLSAKEKSERRLKATLRVLAVYPSPSEKASAASALTACQEYGLRVYPFVSKGWGDLKRLLYTIRRYNITVVQGDLPVLVRWWITVYMGFIKQYVAPVFIEQTVHDHISSKDYLRLYQTAWEETR